MNRREAIITGVAGVAAAVAVASRGDAQASQASNPDLDQIRALLRAHDEAFTNQDLNGVLACFTEKAAIMGSGPGKSGQGRTRSRWLISTSSKGSTRENRNSNTSSRSVKRPQIWVG